MNLAISALAALVVLSLPSNVEIKDGAQSARPCKYEDSVSCVWDARHMGNGEGKSFRSNAEGKITFINHKRAHSLLNR